MDSDAPLAFLRLHVVGFALLVLERSITQLAGPDVGNGVRARFPGWIRLAVDTPRPGNDAQAAYRLIVHRHAPGDLGRFLASDRLLPPLMDIGDQHDIGNYAFRMALQDQSIRQPADQVILHPEIGLAEPDRRPVAQGQHAFELIATDHLV